MGHPSDYAQEAAGRCAQGAPSRSPRHCKNERKRQELPLMAGSGQVTGADGKRLSSV